MKRTARTLALLALALAAVLLWRALEEPDRAGSLAPEESATASTDATTPSDPVEGGRLVDDAQDREAVGAQPASEPPRVTHVVRGRVVDERRFPVEGATVRLSADELDEAPSTRTEADGTFELAVSAAEIEAALRASVLAKDDAGGGAVEQVYLFAPEPEEVATVEVGALVLLEARPLTVRVVRGESPAPDVMVSAAVGHHRHHAGVARTNERGEARFDALPRGPVHLLARTDAEDAAGHVTAWIPRDAEVPLRLCDTSPLEVTLVDEETGAPVTGAVVRAARRYRIPFPLASDPEAMTRGFGEMSGTLTNRAIEGESDASGRALLRGLLPDARYRIEVLAEGYHRLRRPPRMGPSVAIACGTPPNPLRVELTPYPSRCIRWPVIDGEAPRPADGTRFTVRFESGAVRRADERPLDHVDARMEGSDLVMDGAPDHGNMLVRAPDGALARVWPPDGDVGKPVSFRPPRTIEVVLEDEHGRPTEGVWVGAFSQGNNPMTEHALTDADGIARIEGLYGHLADVEVTRGPTGHGISSPLGSVDLDRGGGRIVAVWPRPQAPRRRARLQVLLDGVPRLPTRYRLSGKCAPEVLEELPESGELRVVFDCEEDGKTPELFLRTVEHGDASVEVPCGPEDAEPVVSIELERRVTLVAHVVPPDEGRMQILPQRFDEQQEEWVQARGFGGFRGLSYPNGPDGSFVFHGLEPGRLRVIDERTNEASEAVEATRGSRRVETHLDLAGSAWVSGRVEVPDPALLSEVLVLVGDQRPPSSFGEEMMNASRWHRLRDGRFRVRVPGDEETTVRPWHPWLVPAAEGGVHVARGGSDGVVLRLVEGDGIALPVEPLPRPRAQIRVGRYAAGAAALGEPLEWHRLGVDGDRLRGNLPAGTWTLFFDVDRTHAPFVLEDVEVDGVTELPIRRLEAGRSVRVRVLFPEGSDADRVSVTARSLDEPYHWRAATARADELVLTGLRAGRYRLRMGRSAAYDAVEQEIDTTGADETQLELDLR